MPLHRPFLTIALLALASIATPTQACMGVAPLAAEDIKDADVVVIGRIANYTIVLDQEMRARMKAIADDPDTPPEQRAFFAADRGFLGDYARFDILVDEILVGRAQATLTVAWDNSTYSEPESMPPGPFLIALRDPGSHELGSQGSGITIGPNPEPGLLTILQWPCSEAFILAVDSAEARASLAILGR
jgi:hypothetical protein